MKDKEQEMREVDDLVFRYQSGDKESGEELLRRFGGHPLDGKLSNYLGKYFRIIRTGIAFKDRDTRKFVSCFLGDPDLRNAMRKWYQYADTKGEAADKFSGYQRRWLSISDEELVQDLRYLFLRQVKRYRHTRKHVYFPGYLYNSYGYNVAQYLVKQSKRHEPFIDMYTREQRLSIHNECIEDRDSIIELTGKSLSHLPFMEDDDELGNAWVRGFTCRDEFKRLSMLHRYILKLYYEDNLGDREIGEVTSMHINTIHKHRKKAIQIVQETIEYLRNGGEIDE